jgi:anaerobic selenocysteine-containing dehydrogenase
LPAIGEVTMSELSRRDFLKLLGVTTAGVSLVGVEAMWGVPDRLVEEALRGPGLVSFKKSICQLCPSGCGIDIRLVDSIPVHIRGGVDHPVSRGGVCPHGAAGLDFLYHPDRIRGPLVRSGDRGQDNWRRASWDEVIGIVSDRLRGLRERGTPEQLAFMTRDDRGLMYEVIRNFVEGIGSPNLVNLEGASHDSLPFELMFGWRDVPEFDIANARFVFSFGDNFLEEGASPVHAIHAFSRMRDREGGGRGRLVFADSRYSLTASNADTYLPIRPGTHGALALGVAYVLIKERYYDRSFVDGFVTGFDSSKNPDGTAKKGFRDRILESYYPERVARITGVPATQIVEVARDFGRLEPSVALFGSHATGGTNGLFNALAVMSLNVLMGNIDRRGGVRVARSTPFRSLPRVSPDEIAGRGLDRTPLHGKGGSEDARVEPMAAFCAGVLSQTPNPIDTLFIYGCNPAFDHLRAGALRGALEKIPFVVSFATIMDESSEYADVILPDHSYLEGWMDSGATRGIAFPHAAVSAPVIEPMYDTRATGDTLMAIARATVDGAQEWYPQDDFVSLLKNRMLGIYRSGDGTVISGSFEESWVQFLKARGWQNLVYESFDDFWNLLVERGGWWNPVSDELPMEEVVRTESGRISLSLNELAEPDRDEPVFDGDENEYPYCLLTFGVLANRNGSGSHSPLLQEMFGYAHRVYWDSWAEINPRTAGRHRLSSGDRVTIRSRQGSVTTRLVFNEAIEPRVIAIPFGLGHTSGGRYAQGIGVNPYEIMSVATDPVWGRPTRMSTRVRIEKAEGRKA